MNEKNLSEFQQEFKNGEMTKSDEKQSGQCQEKKADIFGKPRKSCSFVRNWGGWLIGDE